MSLPWRIQVYCSGAPAWAFKRLTTGRWVCSCGKPLPWLKDSSDGLVDRINAYTEAK